MSTARLRRPVRSTVRSALLTQLVAIVAVVAGLGLLAPLQPPAAHADEPPFVTVHIDQVTPDVVTTTSEPVLTVTGTVTNVGDRPVREVMVRLERAAAVASSAGLRTNLTGSNDQYRPITDFLTISPELARGQQAHFTVSAPVHSPEPFALDIDRTGVYPLLVNVNGTPDYGDPAHLDDARFLLPVTGLPKAAGTPDSEPLAGVVAPDTSAPVGMTVLWPLADRPRLTPGAPGGTLPVRLLDDDLATSLAPGGRLDGLLGAVEFATAAEVDPDGVVGRAVCLAVDPDLLVTVNAMTGGYLVADTPESPDAVAGTGQRAATDWLERLRRAAQHTCVIATPYAQADLNALARIADPGLTAGAIGTGADVVDRILQARSVRGAVLLADERISAPTVHLLDDLHGTVVLAAGDCSAQDSVSGAAATTDVAPRRVAEQVVLAPFDPAVGAALAGLGATPAEPVYLDPTLATALDHDSPTARRQDALGAMLWRALEPTVTPRTEIITPPALWQPRVDDARAVLSTLGTALRSGLATAAPLPAVIAGSMLTAGTAVRPVPLEPPVGRFDDAVIDSIVGQVGPLAGLTAALIPDPRTGLTGEQYTAPLREDMLRALSQTEPAAVRNRLAAERLAVVGETTHDLIGAVTIVEPAGVYTLATEHSPLPVALRNDLAVPIRVRLQVDAPPGMTVTDVGVIVLPPGFLPLKVPVEVPVNQRVAVDVALRTPDGLPLGEPARLSVHSNAYGMVLFMITMSAAAVLSVLTGRRLWHRFRGQPDRADLDRPDPGDPA